MSAMFVCTECKKSFANIKCLKMHERTHASSSSGAKNNILKINERTTASIPGGSNDYILNNQYEVKEINSAFKTRVVTLSVINPDEGCLLPEVFLKEASHALKKKFIHFLRKHNSLKFNIELYGLYAKPNLEDLENTPIEVKFFQTKMKEIYDIEEYDELFSNKIENILKKMEEFQERDSGWTLVQLNKIELNMSTYQPLKGSTFSTLSKKIKLKKSMCHCPE